MNQDYLKYRIKYNKHTGEFYWGLPYKSSNKKEGQRAGTNHPQGYRHINIDGKLYLAHRLAWLYEYGAFPVNKIDHINGDKADNRIENLRECTQQENCYNRVARTGSKSGIKNVCWNKNIELWQVIITYNGTRKCLGNFEDIELAELVAKEARIKYHKEYARF
jgi:hypothetical protein